MQIGRHGVGTSKHRKSGHAKKSPGIRHYLKLSSERNERKDRSAIKEPYGSLRELLKGR
jgi:hypothetical protein